MPFTPADRPVTIYGRVGQQELRNNCLLGFIQVLLKICHEGCAARSHSRGVGCVGLMLAINVAVGIADVDLAKLGEEIDAGTIGSPEIRDAGSSIANIAGEQGAILVINGLLQSL